MEVHAIAQPKIAIVSLFSLDISSHSSITTLGAVNICQHLKKEEIFSLWGGGVKVLVVFLNVDLNLLSKIS